MLSDGQNRAVVQTELDTVFFQTFDHEGGSGVSMAEATTGSLFKQQPLDRYAWIGEVNQPPGLFPALGELGTVPQASLRVSNKYTVPVVTFAQSIPVSKQFFDDNMHGVWAEDVRQLALAAKSTQNRTAFQTIFNNAFTTTLTADGAAFIGTHTLLNGGTYSNQISGALSETTLTNAYTKMYTMVNQAGISIGNEPKYLVVPPKLLKLATQLTDSVLVSDSGNNAVNFWRSAMGIEIWTSNWMDASVGAGGSDTAWFLLSNRHSITRLVRQGMETNLRDWGMSNNLEYLYQANFRESYFVPDYNGVVGSTGV